MDLIICPGIDKLYAVAVTTPAGGFERVSEHDNPEDACLAKFRAEVAADLALIQLKDFAA